MLHGRAEERSRLELLLSETRKARGGALVLSGELGIGKTALLADTRARAKGFRALRATGVAAESPVAFAGLDQLLGGVLDVLDEIPAPQAGALRSALDLTSSARVDRDAVLRGTSSVLGRLAAGGPVLCTVDDAHLLDPPSLAALSFAARRLSGERVALLFARGEADVPALDGIEPVELRGLGVEAARALLDDVRPGIHPDVVARLVEVTGGNPLALAEAPSVLTEEQLAGHVPLAYPLPVGEELARAFAVRAEDLSTDGRRALLVAAAADTQALRVITEPDAVPGVTAAALEECELVDLVQIRRGRVTFRHPLARAAVYGSAAPAEQRDAHRRLAEASRGERRALHLAAAAAGPDEEAAGELEAAGLRALGRAGYAVAAAWLEQAAELTPEPARRARRLAGAARAACVAGRPDRARALAETGLELSDDAAVTAELGAVLAALEAASAQAGRGDALRPAGVAATLGRASALAAEGDVEGGRALVADAQNALDGDSDRRNDPETLVLLADALWNLARPPPELRGPVETAVASARLQDAVWFLPRALVHRARLGFLDGSWTAAEADAQEALSLAVDLRQAGPRAGALALLARVAAAGGRTEDCVSLVRELESVEEDAATASGRSALGLLDLGLGRLDEAIGELESATATLRAPADGTSTAAVDLVEALARAGRAEEARAAARRCGRAGGFFAQAEAAWGRALAASPRSAARLFAVALAQLEEAGSPPFARARVELALGERLRRAGTRAEAREHLRAAHGLFDGLGATPWAERARTELLATGETARRRDPTTLDELTPQELLVMQTIAAGATYREAAQSLFLSPKTIEFHLGKVYRKLGVRSRRELLTTLERLEAEGADVTAGG